MLIFWGLYLLFEASLYFFNFRLKDVVGIWPQPALLYSLLIEKILGSLFLLTALVTFAVQRNLAKYKTFLKISAIWSLFHGSLLIFLGWSQNYAINFSGYPSLLVWFPLYNFYLILEGIALLSYSVLVYFWLRHG